MEVRNRPERLSPAEFAGSSELVRLMSSGGPEGQLEEGERPLEILLVEDQEDLNRSWCLRLEQEGYRVTSAFSGNRALDEYARREPDLVLLDLSSPQSNGLEILQQLRRQAGPETTPIVVLTAGTDPVLECEAMLWGAREVVHKPVSTRRLLGTLQAFTRRAREPEATE